MKGTLGFIIISVLLWYMALAQEDEAEPNIFKTEKFKYYIETQNKFTWSEAEAECKNRKMNLVSIETKTKSDDVELVLNEAFVYKKKPVPRLYIGANDLDEFREFVWVTKGEIFSYTNWEKSEPNNYEKLDERCVHIGYHGDAKWNDINCNRKFGFMCEQVLGEESSDSVAKS